MSDQIPKRPRLLADDGSEYELDAEELYGETRRVRRWFIRAPDPDGTVLGVVEFD